MAPQAGGPYACAMVSGTFDEHAAVDERGHTVDQAFAMVKDAIRYALLSRRAVRRGRGRRLRPAGKRGLRARRSPEPLAAEEYKGVNSRWRVPDSGQLFEVQFHTQASLDAKEETHGAYEPIRSLPDDDAEVGKLHAYQREVTAKIPIPPGAPGIPDYPQEHRDYNEEHLLRDRR